MWRRRIERALIILLGLLVVSGALLLGGVHPENQLRLAVSALILFGLAILWRTSKRGALSLGAPFWVLLGVAGICLVQFWDLPAGLQAWLQPRGAALFTYATEGLGAPVRHSLSLDPPGTALELAKALGLAALAGAAALLVRDGPRALLLLWTVNVGAMSLALLAAVQLALGASAVFWVYAPEAGRGFVAPFVNPNHAGAFYGAVTFLNLGLSLEIRERRAQVEGAALTALPAALVILSASRGAIVATAAGAILFLALHWRAGVLSTRRFGYAVATTVLLGTVALPSSSIVRRELGERTKWEAIDNEVKIEAWRDALPAAAAHFRTGMGRGAFRAAFPPYQRLTAGSQRTFTHPENLVVQWLVEVGPVLFAVLLFLVVGLAIRYFRRTTLTPLHAIALCPVLVLVAQNFVDFNLEFAGTAFLVACLLGVLAGLGLGRTGRVQRRARRLARAAGLLTVTAAGLVAALTWGKWGADHDLRTEGRALAQRLEQNQDPAAVLSATQRAIRRHPADYYLEYLAGTAALRIKGQQPLRYFNRALYLNPRSTLTQYQVGRALMALGLYRQALSHHLEALRLGLPLSGSFSRSLFRLLQILSNLDAPARQSLLAAGSHAGLGVPGAVPPADSVLTAAFIDVRRAEPFARVARVDVAAAYQLAQWLEQVKLYDLARAAYAHLHRLDPARLEYLEALVQVCDKAKEEGRALYWARRWVARSKAEDAYARLGALLRDAWKWGAAERAVDQGLLVHRQSPALIALKAEVLIHRGQVHDARQLLVERMVGAPMQIKDEITLLGLRIRIEEQAGNKRRVARLKSRLGELQNMVKAGYQGLSPRQRPLP